MAFDPGDKITIKMTAMEWQQVLSILQKSVGFPYEVTAPLIVKINTQAVSQMKPDPTFAMQTMRGDGVSDTFPASE